MKKLGLCLAALCLMIVMATPLRAEVCFIDDSGQSIRLEKAFSRIISLYGAHTENLFSLGLDQEIIGVSINDSYPTAALNRPRFSYRDDPERLLAARPDLVLVRPMIMRGYRGLVESLRQAGVTVVSLQPRDVSQMFGYWRKLGALTGRQAQAETMVERFKKELSQLKSRVAGVSPEARPKVYFESIHRRYKTFAQSSMAIFALEAAGGLNLATGARPVRGSNIASFGKERILSLAQRMDVYLAQKGPMNRVSVEEIMDEPGFRALKAVKEQRVYIVDEKLVSRPTLRLLQGIAAIQNLLYPRLASASARTGGRP